MTEELLKILEALEKPLRFVSKNDFLNISKVKDLDQLVSDLTLKALSLSLSSDELNVFRTLRQSFSLYKDLKLESKKKLIEESLNAIADLKKDKHSTYTHAPQTSQPVVKESSIKEAPEKKDLSQIPFQYVKGVGPRISNILAKRGIKSVEDALYYFPRRYEDRRRIKKISGLKPYNRETVMGKIILTGKVRTKRRELFQVVLSDGTGRLNLVWFQYNEKYLRAVYKKEAIVILSGETTVDRYTDSLQIIHPRPEDTEIIDNEENLERDFLNFNRIVPIYPLTEGIKQRRLRSIMKTVVDTHCHHVIDCVPEEIKRRRHILNLGDALSRVHFSSDSDRLVDLFDSGYQAAIMAPTEILAEQHLRSIIQFTRPAGVKVVLLTSGLSKKERYTYYEAIKTGEADIAIGTHALIEQGVEFKNLGFVVIDEQHRFGVIQRAELRSKGKNPDVLVMTATPIPRTLAMTVYGDLDVSVIDEMPPGRKPIKTIVFYEEKGKRKKAYDIVREEVKKGRQVYIVYPMIEESESPDFKGLKYATLMADELRNKIFPEFQIGLLHGRMKTEEKDEVMRRFISHDLDILVSTTVIEVGVDVPNATVMVVENAERFGLSQLHQLRGRIGRGEHESVCILISGYKRSEEAQRRLSVLEKTTDGFRIAEADLMIRGPGDCLGTKQSGLPEFRFANLIRDVRILSEAREEAFRIVNESPTLTKHPGLVEEVSRRWGGRLELARVS